MEQEAVRQQLNEAISAIRSGDRVRGRDLLLQLVQTDERLEPAWLWLSTALDDPADKLVALENALTLNPNNAHARTQIQLLKKQFGIAEAEPTHPPAPEVAPSEPVPVSAPAPTPPAEELYQCIYCGQPTKESDRRCPHCRQDLLGPSQWNGKGFQHTCLVLCGLYVQVALLQSAGASLLLALAYGLDPTAFILLRKLPLVATLLGDFMVEASRALATTLFTAALVRAAILLALTLTFYTDMDAAYWAALLVVPLDLAWNRVANELFHHPGASAALLNAGLGVVIFLIALLALFSRARTRGRLWVELDKDAKAPQTLYRRGYDYGRQGKWALAALHFEKAAALRPTEPHYLKDLGVAQARLGRYPQALKALRAGAELAPDDAEYPRLIEAVEEKIRPTP
ncbi:MAG: hypothetical protein ACRDH2_15825 [Anaerolineales bacterium]